MVDGVNGDDGDEHHQRQHRKGGSVGGGSRCLTEVRGGSWRLVRVPGG